MKLPNRSLKIEVVSKQKPGTDFQGTGIFTAPSLKYNVLQNVDISISAMMAHVFKRGNQSSDFDYLDKYGLYFASLMWYF